MMALPELLTVVAIACGAAVVVAAGGWLALRALRGRSLTVWLSVVATVTVVATLAGVLATALAMFISAHDRSVLIALVVVAGAAGLTVAVALGRGTARGSRRLQATVAAVGDPGRFAPPPAGLVRELPAELADVARELERTHHRITELREREQALEDSRRELVAWVSHDLRTPLAGLRAMAEALEDQVVADADTVRRYYVQIRSEVDRLAAMVDDLFELARIHAGALRLSRGRVGLDALVNETVAAVDPLAVAAGVRLYGAPTPGLPVDVDAAQLGRALRNIVVNAVRHTPGDGSVEVTSAAEDGMACVTVSDACGGIPEQDLPRVFDVAFRGSSARTPGPGEGAGLGLAIARGIVEAHAGEIGVTNVGRGCRFVVRLPLSR
ncbi:MAG: two-component sensor histidine kinase [Streptosporangiales bacterium]|nr:two-component sensor histidine kinase [Streptosporangiales bacterium]